MCFSVLSQMRPADTDLEGNAAQSSHTVLRHHTGALDHTPPSGAGESWLGERAPVACYQILYPHLDPPRLRGSDTCVQISRGLI